MVRIPSYTQIKCEKKIAYQTLKEVKVACAKFLSKNGKPQRHYQCSYCGLFHTTHLSKRRYVNMWLDKKT